MRVKIFPIFKKAYVRNPISVSYWGRGEITLWILPWNRPWRDSFHSQKSRLWTEPIKNHLTITDTIVDELFWRTSSPRYCKTSRYITRASSDRREYNVCFLTSIFIIDVYDKYRRRERMRDISGEVHTYL